MKKLLVLLVLALLNESSVLEAQKLSPYFEIASLSATEAELTQQVKDVLQTAGFRIIGEFKPGNNSNLKVIVYTRTDLENLAIGFADRGALAIALKVGIRQVSGKSELTMLNPEYLFNAYFGKKMGNKEADLKKISEDAKNVLKSFGLLNPFGGSVEKEDLQEYQYMFGMPYFTDPVVLKTFKDFASGVSTIKANLDAKKGGTALVYSYINESKKIAVFGVALNDAKKGEACYLPIIGEKHIAATPYEIILQGNQASILHGRYRIALHWPELTMGTFTKIMNTPGEIEDMMKMLVN